MRGRATRWCRSSLRADQPIAPRLVGRACCSVTDHRSTAHATAARSQPRARSPSQKERVLRRSRSLEGEPCAASESNRWPTRKMARATQFVRVQRSDQSLASRADHRTHSHKPYRQRYQRFEVGSKLPIAFSKTLNRIRNAVIVADRIELTCLCVAQSILIPQVKHAVLVVIS